VKVSQNHRLCAAARLEIDDVVGENKPAIGSNPLTQGGLSRSKQLLRSSANGAVSGFKIDG
jgi:hypothetical protein